LRVFVLGAGASKSYDQSPTNQRMPIAGDFFQTFDQLDISANPWVLQEGLLGYLSNAGIHDPGAYLRNGIDIEELHSQIESKRNQAIAEGCEPIKYMLEQRAYTELIFIFASVINEIQNGPVSTPHRSIAKHLTCTDAVITFNWDTLMDRALSAETDWDLNWGYGVTPRSVFSDGWKPAVAQPNGVQAPELIKLHGSTNWITGYAILDDGVPVLTHDLAPDTLHIFEQAQEPYTCFAGRYMEDYEPYSYGYYPPNLVDIPGRAAPEGMEIISVRPKVPWRREGDAPSDGLVSMPLIVPPVKQKNYELFGTLFANLWKSAEDALSKADEIVIIGYSFPRTDLQSHQLFQNAFLRRTTVPHVTIIDPAPQNVASKFRNELGISGENLTVFKDYFSANFDLSTVS
jgi:hypothetical protein